MNILMLTNVFTPQIGGITRSIQEFSREFEKRGHQVLIVAPAYKDIPPGEANVVRTRAIPNFYENRYPLPLPTSAKQLTDLIDLGSFKPDVVHTHHPFLLGGLGHSVAASLRVPLVYTHHTRYSLYIENKTNWPEVFEEAMIQMVLNYCNLSDAVIAPSSSIKSLLRTGGVDRPIHVIPTGVDPDRFVQGNGNAIRRRYQIPAEAFVVGHVGRLSIEKNISFLARGIGQFLVDHQECPAHWGQSLPHCLVVGEGDAQAQMQQEFERMAVADRVHFVGPLEGQNLVDAYHAMDIFAFASHTETQGMVLSEAMAANLPVVAVAATGVNDLVRDGINGWLVPSDNAQNFAKRLSVAQHELKRNGERIRSQLRQTVQNFSLVACADRVMQVYQQSIENSYPVQVRAVGKSTESARAWEAMWNRRYNEWKAVESAVSQLFGNRKALPKI